MTKELLQQAQQEQPASVDAYVGAREDAAIWKKRALEAEELNRKFIAELNGPTYLGEPVKQEQPAAWTRHPNPVHHIGPLSEEHLRDVVERTKAMQVALDAWVAQAQSGQTEVPCPLAFVERPAPALSETEVWNSNEIMAANSEIGLSLDKLMKLVRAIEAHCRGGNHEASM